MVGSGITGVMTALSLLRNGCRVTLVDRWEPGPARPAESILAHSPGPRVERPRADTIGVGGFAAAGPLVHTGGESAMSTPATTSHLGPLGSTIHVLRADAATIAELAAVDWSRHFGRVSLDPARGLITLMSPSRLHDDLSVILEDIVDLAADAFGRTSKGLRSTRLRPRGDPPGTGLEPDCAFYVGERAERYRLALMEGEAAAARRAYGCRRKTHRRTPRPANRAKPRRRRRVAETCPHRTADPAAAAHRARGAIVRAQVEAVLASSWTAKNEGRIGCSGSSITASERRARRVRRPRTIIPSLRLGMGLRAIGNASAAV